MTRSRWGHAGGTAAAVLLLVGIAEAAIMISPFAAFFYAGFRPFLNILSDHAATAWLNGFFLNHALITRSPILEGQRLAGRYMFALGMWGFAIGFLQIYVAKILRFQGVMRWGLYWGVRHPQYLCLIVAGWGLLTIWPRFFLLGLWVTMAFVYFLLARIEEARMEETTGEAYRSFRKWRGAFLPFSPGERLYALTFGRIRRRAVGFVLCYLSCLVLAFGAALAAKGYVKAATSWIEMPAQRTVALAVWPREEKEIRSIMERVFRVPAVRNEMRRDGARNFVAHILPSDYGMNGMYYTMPGQQRKLTWDQEVRRIKGVAGFLLLPWRSGSSSFRIMGSPLDSLHVVISRSTKPYRPGMPFDECVDEGVKLRPVILVALHAAYESSRGPSVAFPARRNQWDDLVMPIF